MSMVDEALIGVPLHTAARLAGLSERRLRTWVDEGIISPEMEHRVSERKVVRLFGFVQLVELKVIEKLLERGSNMREVKIVLENLEELDGIRRPLSQFVWALDGRHIVVQHPDGTWMDGKKRGQGVMRKVLNLDEIRSSVREWLAAPRSSDEAGHAAKRRGVMRSRPVFAGTRTPVSAVQEFLEAGCSTAEILEAYPHLTEADVDLARSMSAA